MTTRNIKKLSKDPNGSLWGAGTLNTSKALQQLKGGGGAGLDLTYGLEYGHFLFETGLDFRFLNSTSNYGFTATRIEDGTNARYSYLFDNLKETRNMAQIGVLFTFEPIIPKLEKLNPVEGAKKIFSMKNLFEFFKNVVKVCFLGYLLYKIIRSSVPELLTMCYGTVDDIFPCLKLMLKRLAVYTAFGYILIAVVDRLFQGKNFIKQMMMTKDEVKREYKEMEGSQEVKQAQRQFRQEIMSGPSG